MFRRIFTLAAVVLMFVSCSSKKEENVKISDLTIIFSGNIGGRYNVCGCRIPTGGLAKRATAIEQIKKEKTNILVFDSASILFSANKHEKGYEYVDRKAAKLTSGIMQELGLNAANVSSFDLADGPDSLKAIDDPGPAVWLSSNIVWKDTGEAVFKPDTVFTAGDIKVGVFGLMEKVNEEDNIITDKRIEVLNPVETAIKEVEKLKKECDFIVGLFYMSPPLAMSMVKKVQGINVIIHSNTGFQVPNDYVEQAPMYFVNNTIITSCPDGGRAIGRLDFMFVNGSKVLKESKQLLAFRYARDNDKEFIPPAESIFSGYFIKLNDTVPQDSLLQKRIDLVHKDIREYANSKGLKLEDDLNKEMDKKLEEYEKSLKK